MINKGRKIYIGAAWPYANNSLHLGHVSALIGSDILARYFRQSGADVLFTSGSDCHGTPIVVAAEEQKIEPKEIALKYHKEFKDNLIRGLGFSYDNYTTTLTEHHQRVVQEIFLKLYKQGDIYTKTETLPYCPKCKRFLPDRYIEGTCPKCNYKNARGDQCDECASLLDPKDLIDPRCKVCSTTPEFRESEHFFLKLSKYQSNIEHLLKESKNWRANAKGFTKKLLNEGIKDRAITRDTTWGIPIPVKGYEKKRIYVWFEAVSGYLTSSIEYSDKLGSPDLWREFWENKNAYHYYVHGKDNIPFHTIIWPTILLGRGGLNLPDAIISSEYLTLEKKQFSKSRHWAVWLPDFLKSFDGDYLRFILTANGSETSDADFSWKEFGERVNKELIGNFSNFIYRTLQLIENNFDSKLNTNLEPNDLGKILIEKTIATFESSGNLIENGHFREALKTIFELAEAGNKFLAETEPWKTIKDDRTAAERDLVTCYQVIFTLSTVIKPFLPRTAEKLEQTLQKASDEWVFEKPKKIEIKKSSPLFKRIESEDIERETKKLES
jgi:methionyl-tRNA synthetase